MKNCRLISQTRGQMLRQDDLDGLMGPPDAYAQEDRGEKTMHLFSRCLGGSALLALWLCTPLVDAAAESDEVGGYEFFFEGERVAPRIYSLRGDARCPGPGDVVWVQGMAVVLGRPGKWRFRRGEDNRSYLSIDGEKEFCATRCIEALGPGCSGAEEDAVTVASSARDGDLVWEPGHPSIGMLRGVRVAGWDAEVSRRLSLLNLAACCVTIHTHDFHGEKLPELPQDVRYLWVDICEWPTDWSPLLGRVKHLVFLCVTGFRPATDRSSNFFSVLRRAGENLKYLLLQDVGFFVEPTEWSGLGGLSDLRVLKLPRCQAVRDLDFVASLSHLRYLGIDGTSVEDLSPALCLPELEELSAVGTRVVSLAPLATSKLRRLNVVGSGASPETTAAFRGRNPGCRVLVKYAESLADALESASGCRVVSGAGRELFREEDPSVVGWLVQTLCRIDDEGCDLPLNPGVENRVDVRLRFYRQDLRLAEVDYCCYDESYIRWSEGWPASARLAHDAGEFLASWVEDHCAEDPCEPDEDPCEPESASRETR